MNKILLFLLILCMVVVNLNNVSAFSDNFNDGSVIDWTSSGTGTWNATYLYAYSALPAAGGSPHSFLNISTTQNTYYSFDIMSSNTGCTAGAYNHQAEFVFFSNATKDVSLSLRNAGVDCAQSRSIVGDGFTFTPVAYNYSEWYNFVVELGNNNIIVSIYNNQSHLISQQQTTLILEPNSQTGISLHNNATGSGTSHAKFDNIVIASYDPDLAASGTISFGSDRYSLGDMAAIDADLVNPNYVTYGYRTIIYNPDGSVNRAWMFPEGDSSQNTFDISMTQLGTYTVKLQYFTDLFNYYDLDTDTTTVTYRSSSLGSAYFSGNYFNVGDIVFFNSTLNNINNSLYFYEVNIIRPNGRTYNSHNITANESYQFTTNEPGEWTGYLVAYPKSSPEDGSNSISDTMITYGSNVGVSWVSFNDTYYTRNSWARINYGIAVNDFYDSHKMQIINQEGTVVFDRQITTQSGYFDYYFYESGKYTVTIDRNWFALDWDLTDNEILASDVTEVTNTIAGGFTLGVTPTTVNCGQTIYLSAETPNVWNTSSFQIKNVSGIIMADISGQAGSWKTNQTGQFWVYLYDGGAIQDTGYFYVYGTCTGYDVMNPDGSGGIKPKPYPQTDQATSNANLQNNLLYFMGLPIFWGMIIFIGALIIAAVNKAGAAIPYLAPGILLFEAVVGLLDPYSSFIIVGFAIVAVMYFVGNFVANRAGN